MPWEYTFVSKTGWDKFPNSAGDGKSGGAPCGRNGGFPKSVANGKSGGGVLDVVVVFDSMASPQYQTAAAARGILAGAAYYLSSDHLIFHVVSSTKCNTV